MKLEDFTCLRCNSYDVRRATRRGWLDQILKKVQVAPYRCRGCDNRYYRWGAFPEDELKSLKQAGAPAAADSGNATS